MGGIPHYRERNTGICWHGKPRQKPEGLPAMASKRMAVTKRRRVTG